jgi:6-phosphogluconate dehydrogenase
MYTETAMPVERTKKSLLRIETRVQMRVMEALGFLKSGLSEDAINEVFLEWNEHNAGVFRDVFTRIYESGVEDEDKLFEAILQDKEITQLSTPRNTQ